MVLKSFAMVSTSFTIGIFFIIIFLFVKIVEANIGSVAFLEPEIVTVSRDFLASNNF